jgi:hypothetical protein
MRPSRWDEAAWKQPAVAPEPVGQVEQSAVEVRVAAVVQVYVDVRGLPAEGRHLVAQVHPAVRSRADGRWRLLGQGR